MSRLGSTNMTPISFRIIFEPRWKKKTPDGCWVPPFLETQPFHQETKQTAMIAIGTAHKIELPIHPGELKGVQAHPSTPRCRPETYAFEPSKGDWLYLVTVV